MIRMRRPDPARDPVWPSSPPSTAPRRSAATRSSPRWRASPLAALEVGSGTGGRRPVPVDGSAIVDLLRTPRGAAHSRQRPRRPGDGRAAGERPVEGLDWHPVRHHLGIAPSAPTPTRRRAAGDLVIEDHDEDEFEELYIVLTGAARFTVDGETSTPRGHARPRHAAVAARRVRDRAGHDGPRRRRRARQGVQVSDWEIAG